MFQKLLRLYEGADVNPDQQLSPDDQKEKQQSLTKHLVHMLLRWGLKVPDITKYTEISARTISRERTRDGRQLTTINVELDDELAENTSTSRIRIATPDHEIQHNRRLSEKHLALVLEDYLRIKEPHLTDLLAIAKWHKISFPSLLEHISEHVGPEKYGLRSCPDCPPDAPLILSPRPAIRRCPSHMQAMSSKSASPFDPSNL